MQLGAQATPEEKTRIAKEAHRLYYEFYVENRIYFEKGLCESLDDFNKLLFETGLQFVFSQRGAPDKTPDVEGWSKAWKAASEKIPALREQVEETFRNLLGVEERGA